MRAAALHQRPAFQPRYRRGPSLMSGKPPINRPAPGPAPRMDLGLVEREALTRIRKSGAVGVSIGDDLLVSTAIRLGLLGLVTIDKATPQRVRARRFSR